MTVIVPLHFGALCDIHNLGVFEPYSVDIACEWLNNGFKSFKIKYWFSVDTLNVVDKFINEAIFLFTILG